MAHNIPIQSLGERIASLEAKIEGKAENIENKVDGVSDDVKEIKQNIEEMWREYRRHEKYTINEFYKASTRSGGIESEINGLKAHRKRQTATWVFVFTTAFSFGLEGVKKLLGWL